MMALRHALLLTTSSSAAGSSLMKLIQSPVSLVCAIFCSPCPFLLCCSRSVWRRRNILETTRKDVPEHGLVLGSAFERQCSVLQHVRHAADIHLSHSWHQLHLHPSRLISLRTDVLFSDSYWFVLTSIVTAASIMCAAVRSAHRVAYSSRKRSSWYRSSAACWSTQNTTCCRSTTVVHTMNLPSTCSSTRACSSADRVIAANTSPCTPKPTSKP